MKETQRMLLTYSLAHFVIDFVCAFFMFSFVRYSGQWLFGALLYNFCAFALQMPIGLLADKWNHNAWCSAIGCALTGIAFFLFFIPLLGCVILGIGNAMFHVGGGIDTLNISTEKVKATGIFVSPGAIGLYLGTLLGKWNDSILPYLIGVLPWLAMAGILWVCQKYYAKMEESTKEFCWSYFHSGNAKFCSNAYVSPYKNKTIIYKICFLFFAMFLVVVIRSLASMMVTFSWKTGYFAFLAVLAVAGGKAMGGILADWMGFGKTACISLVLSMLFIWGGNHVILALLAVFFFQMTMPLTLWAAANLLSDMKGFAFGTLTFALFIGWLPSWLGMEITNSYLIYSILCVISLILLLQFSWWEGKICQKRIK